MDTQLEGEMFFPSRFNDIQPGIFEVLVLAFLFLSLEVVEEENDVDIEKDDMMVEIILEVLVVEGRVSSSLLSWSTST